MRAYEIFKTIEMINSLNKNIRGKDLYSITFLSTSGFKMYDCNDYDSFVKFINKLYHDDITTKCFRKNNLSYQTTISDDVIYLYIDEV